MKSKKTVSCVIALLCILVLCLSGCSSEKAAVIMLSQSIASEDISGESKDKSLYVETKTAKDLTKVTRSDLITLYFDKNNYSISVYDSGSTTLWSALPEKYTDETPAVLSVDVLADGKIYTLNSQDDSVARGLASYEVGENGELTVTYQFERETESGGKISFAAAVKYSVSQGVFSAGIDCLKIKDSIASNFTVTNIRLLDYFGSGTSGNSGDYIFIPDGSGAIIDTAKKAKEFEKITVAVYGDDLALSEKSDASASVAVFGIKKQSAAFAATVEKGDAVCKIIAEKALEKTAYNRVGAQFCITQTGETQSGKAYAAKKSYQSEIKITYRFLSGSNADYASMAAACREGFIRNGVLTMQDSVESTSSAPLVLNIVGEAVCESGKKADTLTTYEQAQEMLTYFRNKGFGNLIVRYKGIFEGGLRQKNSGEVGFNKELGSKEEMAAFFNYAALQNISVYADVNLLTAENCGAEAALTPDSTAASKNYTDIKTKVLTAKGTGEFIAAHEIENEANALIKQIKSSAFSGVCLADAAKYLYSDYSSKSPALKSEVCDLVSKQCAAVSCIGSLMTDSCNIYSVKYSDFIANIPQTAAVADREYCTAVPFLQILFHGVKNYSLKPANLCSNPETQFLKCAEYGAVLSCEAYYENFGSDKTADSMNYLNFGAQLQSYYERLGKIADLSDKKITDHYTVKSGVTCTKYSGDITVYVNYNKKDAKVGDVTVEARSFLVLR
ncbi:MAG: DUF5696 domain-containing protein [Acutalibacteraceae bacterium]